MSTGPLDAQLAKISWPELVLSNAGLNRMRRLVVILAAVVLIAAACGGDDGESVVDASPTSVPATVSAPVSSSSGDSQVSTVAVGWTRTSIGQGTKPSLALDADGRPAIAFLFEDVGEGFVAYASAAQAWAVEPVVEGYFYGPIGLDFDPQNRPNIAYHDHQASSFDRDLGDLTYALRDGAGWQIEAATSDGHDGWDSTIRVGPDGVVRAAGVDPAQFGRVEGVEYYELVDGVWNVEAIGSGPTEYEWNVDLQVAPDGTVGLTYFATESSDLVFASRAPGGAWEIEVVTSDGDVGRFSSFEFDAGGAAHISYWAAGTGEVSYATNLSGVWETSSVAELANVEIGFEGARRITSLALDPEGSPVIAFSDTSGIWLARQSADGTWSSEQIVTAGDLPLGQLVSAEVDGEGTPHIAYFEVTGNGPLSGEVVYATPAN